MKPFVFAALTAVGLSIASIAPLKAQPMPERLRGTVTDISAQSLVIHTRDNRDLTITLDDQTHYAAVVKSSLDNVAEGSYIGTATKETGSRLIALEITVFPPEMRGLGEGHYPWDKISDTTLANGTATSSAMTNGNVSTVTKASETEVKSAMTNGNVATSTSKGGVTTLKVTYKGGEQTVLVPPTAPVVAIAPGTKDDVEKGAGVFVVAIVDGDKAIAKQVAVGKDGVVPPM
ncbi:hypothetical protein [Thalassospira marina]|uniref:Metal ABC transporter permease n=1 Tax=Thalassospira marina TaxID=2048283 RepID=A0A2N3KRP7_9PROT|nr:hypothetical protein [Thalassospira marina]AUG53621.1 hypothetical protein CSC3H3_13520 [Thalassospira marina]PKR53153.1 hypothetical protein COO20_15905 [Thalassospira marina]